MTDNIYVVYFEDEHGVHDENTGVFEVCGFATKYFTNYEEAEIYRDLLNVMESTTNHTEDSYKIVQVECADGVDYASQLEYETEKLNARREEMEKRIAKVQKSDRMMYFAKLKSEFEGGNWIEILAELKEKYGD